MAGQYRVEGDLLAQGVNCWVRIDRNDPNGSNPEIIGFVESADIRKNIQLQRAECIGEILPVSLDPTSVSTTVSLNGFLPTKQLKQQGTHTVRGGGASTLKGFNPDDSKLLDTRAGTKIPYLDLWDARHKAIIGSSCWLYTTSYSDGIQGKGYVKASVSLEGIGYNNGPDYDSEL